MDNEDNAMNPEEQKPEEAGQAMPEDQPVEAAPEGEKPAEGGEEPTM